MSVIGSIEENFRRVVRQAFARVPVPPALTVEPTVPLVVVVPRHSAILFEAAKALLVRAGAKHVILPGEQDGNLKPMDGATAYITAIEDLGDEQCNRILASSPAALAVLSFHRDRGPLRELPSLPVSRLMPFGILLSSFYKIRRLTAVCSTPENITAEKLSTPRRIRRFVRAEFYKNLRQVRGVPFQSLETQERACLSGVNYRTQLNRIAEKSGKSVKELHRAAVKEFRTIAADPKPWLFIPVAVVCGLFLKRLFPRCKTEGLDRVSLAMREHTVVLVPMHRSHLDYVLLTYSLYQAGMNTPLIAAGINLRFWPVGSLIHKLGGYFVRRDASSNHVHRLVLERYLQYLVRRGHTQKFYIEGGRSRSGRMRAPRRGILRFLLGADAANPRKKLAFIPVSLAYERIVEESILADENAGVPKTKESFFSLLNAGSLLKQRYGEVQMCFGDAIIPRQHPSPGEEESVRISTELTKRIRDSSALTLSSLVYSSILMQPGYGMEVSKLRNHVRFLAALAKDSCDSLDKPFSVSEPLATFLASTDSSSLDDALLVPRVEQASWNSKRFLFIKGQNRYQADFYRNHVYHLFFPASFVFALQQAGLTVRDPVALQVLRCVRFDLQLPSLEAFVEELEAIEGYLEHSRTQNEYSEFWKNPRFIESLLQTYWFTLHTALEQANELGRVQVAELTKVLRKSQLAAKYLGHVNRTEALSRANIDACLESLRRAGIFRAAGDGEAEEKEGEETTHFHLTEAYGAFELLLQRMRMKSPSGTLLIAREKPHLDVVRGSATR